MEGGIEQVAQAARTRRARDVALARAAVGSRPSTLRQAYAEEASDLDSPTSALSPPVLPTGTETEDEALERAMVEQFNSDLNAQPEQGENVVVEDVVPGSVGEEEGGVSGA